MWSVWCFWVFGWGAASVDGSAPVAAARTGDAGALTAAMTPVRLKERGFAGRGLLHEAVFSGSADVVAALCTAGAEPNQTDDLGWTPLMEAAAYGHAAVAGALLAAGGTPDVRDPEGRTALMVAAARDRADLVRLLLDAGADPSARDHAGHGPADFLPADASETTVALLDAAKRDRGVFVPVPDARREAAPAEVTRRPLVDGRYYEGLAAAVWTGDIEVVRQLTATGAARDAAGPFGETPLHLAVERGRHDLISILTAGGAPVNARDRGGWTPLLCAAALGEGEALSLLLKAGADPNLALPDGLTALMAAADRGDTLMVKSLLRTKAARDAADARGRTVLDHVNKVRHADLYRLLRQLGLRSGGSVRVVYEKNPTVAREEGLRKASEAAALKPVAKGAGFFLTDGEHAAAVAQAVGALRLGKLDEAASFVGDLPAEITGATRAAAFVHASVAAARGDAATLARLSEALRGVLCETALWSRTALALGRLRFGRNPDDTGADAPLVDAWRWGGDTEALWYWARLEAHRGMTASAVPLAETYAASLAPDGDAYREATSFLARWRRRATVAAGGAVDTLAVFPPGARAPALDLTAYRGKVVLLDFWSSWAAPTDDLSDLYPILRQLYKWQRNKPYVAFSISGNTDTASLQAFVKKHRITWPVYQDVNLQETYDLFGLKGYPSLVVLDHEGKVILKFDGFTVNYADNLRTTLKEAMERVPQ